MTREDEILKAKRIFYASSDDQTFYNKGFEEGAKWADKTMIEKACKWLKHQEEMIGVSFEEDFIERFRKAMS